MQKERVLEQIHQVRSWGISHGLTSLETMYSTESEDNCFWWVMWMDSTDKSKTGYYFFGTDERSARKWNKQAKKGGLITSIRTGASAGAEDIPIVSQLINTSEFARIQIILHEALHVWMEKTIFSRCHITRELDEALAEYLSLKLMVLFFRDKKPNKTLVASEYQGFVTAEMFAIEHLAVALKSGDPQMIEKCILDWDLVIDKFDQYFSYPDDESDEEFDPKNEAQMREYREYSYLFFDVQDFFQKNQISPLMFLENPKPYKRALLGITKTEK